jgi:16S rRNA (uracil1498-N3)-methyltransferase
VSARFYCPDLAQNDKPRLGAEEARHLSRVCRLGVGDVVEVFDGKGYARNAQVVRVENNGVNLIAVGPPLADAPAPVRLTLASAVPKGDRFDWLIEKATELGVERLIPIVTERSVVDPGGPKLDRLRRTIVEASKQCRRSRLMLLDSPMPWDHVAGLFHDSIRLLADPNGLAPSRWPATPHGQSVILAIGPEGGFTASERRTGDLNGWLAISLGINILRIETAGLAGCAGMIARVPAPDQ